MNPFCYRQVIRPGFGRYKPDRFSRKLVLSLSFIENYKYCTKNLQILARIDVKHEDEFKYLKD